MLSVGPQIDKSFFGNKRLEAGANIGLLCFLTQGDLPVTFNWMKDGKPMEITYEVEVESQKVSSSLIIARVKQAHVGNYTCIARNPVGSSIATAEILVNGNWTYFNLLEYES